MAVKLRDFLTSTDQGRDITVSVIYSILGTDGTLYALETDPSDPRLPTGNQLQFDRNGADTTPTLDTSTPTNNRPLPVLLAKDGAEVDFGTGSTSNQTQRVALATDSTVTTNAPQLVTFAINDNSTTNITTGAYVELVTSLASSVTHIDVQDTGGQWYYISTGASGSEINIAVIAPGGNGFVPLNVSSGTRVSVKAISGTADAGYLGVNFYG